MPPPDQLPHLATDPDAMRLALTRAAYVDRRFRLAAADLAGFSHLVASRQGLFAINRETVQLVAHGLFFGLVTTPDAIYVFESGDLARHGGSLGRLVRLDLSGQRITSWKILAEGLSSGCHQIDLIDGRVHVVDTYHQCIRWYATDGEAQGEYRPFPAAAWDDWSGGYLHINSLLAVRDARLLLLHNGGAATGAPSELAILDTQWRLLERRPLPGLGCHNLALLEDGSLLTCASLTGEIADLAGRRVRLSTMMTRGLSVAPDLGVVGASQFSHRLQRHTARGELVFLDGTLNEIGRLAVPAAPTDIRRLSGSDMGQSAYTCTRSPRFV